jgi:Mn2+/Fe2+ NRAMP family transporter
VFVNVITGMIMISAFVAIIPGLPVISLLVAVQVVNGLLLPINLFFIWRLARSAHIMGERRSRGLMDAVTLVTVALLSTLSVVLVIVTVGGL